MRVKLLSLDDLTLSRRKALVRVDFNVPVRAGVIQDDTRIRAGLPTVQRLLAMDAALVLVSHLGRPREGHYDENYTLAPVAERLAALLNRDVPLLRAWQDGVSIGPGEVVMLENIRFMAGETTNDEALARRLAGLCDVYVNDAFASAHRAQASTYGAARYAPAACAGPLLLAEVETLTKALEQPRHPMTAIVGGAKVSTKLTALKNLIKKVDALIVGGGIANTFLKAAGAEIGASLYEDGLIAAAADVLAYGADHDKEIPLPVDVVCAKSPDAAAVAEIKSLADIRPDDLILDVGPETIRINDRLIRSAATVLWNGPLGVFELEPFSAGTAAVAAAIAANRGLSVAGGGDTLSAIARFGAEDSISRISTGGGAFLEWLEGKTLPAIAILEERARARRAAR